MSWGEPDEANSEWALSTQIEFLFLDLCDAESAEEHRSICANLIRHARHLHEAELSALAEAVERGFQRQGRGRPKNHRRARAIRHMLMLGPAFGGMAGLPRADVIRAIAAQYSMTPEAAGKAYDEARKELAAGAAARNAEVERTPDLFP